MTDLNERAIFASGCFWGTQYYFDKAVGVLETDVGYIGGGKKNPTYQEVCTGATGHAEAVEVIFNPEEISYETLARLFFETHDPTHIDRQGPDVGTQYRSEIFYLSDSQKETAERLIGILTAKGYEVATRVSAAGHFWSAENYHQQYYEKNGQSPYCHIFTPRF